MVILGDVSHVAACFGLFGGSVNLVSVRLEIVLISTYDRCMVCAEHRKGLEIILDASEGTPT